MSKKLYVGNLLYETTEDDLKEYFGAVAPVLSATVIRFQDGKSKGFAFVEMESEEGAQKVIDALNSQDYKGRKIVVAEARPPQPREDRFRGGNSRDSRGGGFYRRDR